MLTVTPITFSEPSKAPPKGGGIADAAGAVIAAITGDASAWNGTHGGKRGFQPGNKFGGAAFRSHGVAGAQKAHTAAKTAATKAIRAHSRKPTADSLAAVQRATRTAAAAHRTLMQARQDHQDVKTAARRDKAAQARLDRSTAEMHDRMAGLAHHKLADLKRGAEAGEHDTASILAGINRISRGTNKAELFAAAKLAGIEHTAKTKGQLSEHLAAHLLGKSPDRQKPARAIDPASHTDHPPEHVGYLGTHLIHFDPERFQYKLDTHGPSGVGGALAGVNRFDHNLGGILSVWKDPANGKVFVVNGHHRLDLAKRLGADKVTVRFLDAPNANSARSIGALQNISEGRGSALDAAKFYRDTGMTREQIAAKGIPIREKINTDGVALSKLDDRTFRRVIDGSITPDRGAIIGDSGLTHPQMQSLTDLVDQRGKKKNAEITNAALREMVDQVKASPTVTKTTKSLFGDDEHEINLAVHRGRLSAGIREKLSREKRLFSNVSRGTAAEDLARGGNVINATESAKISQDASNALAVYDMHKNLAGPISRALNEASESISNGTTHAKALSHAYGKILAGVRETLG